ncbi:MAG TPA: hypothetical protein VMN78_04805, partial [Longimicrobiales bacterium]|nr:hypothetical protein [Longimicrobiales bacterium]
FYTHSRIRQGHTHGGQLLGAAIGPGADAQFVGVDLVDDWGFGGLFVERVRRNDGSSAAITARYAAPYEHDTEITFGGRGLLLHGAFSVGGQAGYSHRWDRDFLQDDHNVFVSIEATWWPSLGDR